MIEQRMEKVLPAICFFSCKAQGDKQNTFNFSLYVLYLLRLKPILECTNIYLVISAVDIRPNVKVPDPIIHLGNSTSGFSI